MTSPMISTVSRGFKILTLISRSPQTLKPDLFSGLLITHSDTENIIFHPPKNYSSHLPEDKAYVFVINYIPLIST
jgi:hypothetical protein